MPKKEIIEGTEIELKVPSQWSRDTIADGTWINQNTINPLFDNEKTLASAIAYTSGGIDNIVDDLASEASRRIEVDNALSAYIDAESAARITGDLTSVDRNENMLRFKNSTGDVLASFDASIFIKDGMVNSAYIDESGKNLVIEFNEFQESAVHVPITIPLPDVFDPSNYYNKTETDELLEAKQNVSNLVTGWGTTTSDEKYPSEKLVKGSLDGKADRMRYETTLSASDRLVKLVQQSDRLRIRYILGTSGYASREGEVDVLLVPAAAGLLPTYKVIDIVMSEVGDTSAVQFRYSVEMSARGPRASLYVYLPAGSRMAFCLENYGEYTIVNDTSTDTGLTDAIVEFDSPMTREIDGSVVSANQLEESGIYIVKNATPEKYMTTYATNLMILVHKESDNVIYQHCFGMTYSMFYIGTRAKNGSSWYPTWDKMDMAASITGNASTATTATTATKAEKLSIKEIGTTNINLDDCTADDGCVHFYAWSTSNKGNVQNKPTDAVYTVEVFVQGAGSTGKYVIQKAYKRGTDEIYVRRRSDGSPAWSSWRRLSYSDETATNATYATKIGTSSSPQQIGDYNTPTYVQADGRVYPCSYKLGNTLAYAGTNMINSAIGVSSLGRLCGVEVKVEHSIESETGPHYFWLRIYNKLNTNGRILAGYHTAQNGDVTPIARRLEQSDEVSSKVTLGNNECYDIFVSFTDSIFSSGETYHATIRSTNLNSGVVCSVEFVGNEVITVHS